MDISPLLSAVLSFIFVLGLLLATLWFVRTRGIGIGALQGKNLRVVNSLRLGPKHRLDVIEYEGKRLLLGVAAGQITLLDNREIDKTTQADQEKIPAVLHRAMQAQRHPRDHLPANFAGLCSLKKLNNLPKEEWGYCGRRRDVRAVHADCGVDRLFQQVCDLVGAL